ncbi:endolytic peptidoglycan transglycosylase RlpA [Candidatus Symbiopectobacterium endolongispinus]|uniref:endolytic peptidoglycan transglycosylase RlpA n=1 Tax=Candidatus Symbiopectobacterium endolongispinus TaxID=2812664 RepID=UPI002079F9A6|nr:endolytic peptidoglycan transglycosylase RlpA [Candidatus Symbiopectobacterium endolongispinus]MBT9429650.1 endolytic peptidoglycan transglycosylase RlpA [Candidatus Symbiopectobacterium endolongispinus]
MRKDWLWVGIVTLMLAACTTTEAPRAPITPTSAYNGPVEEIGGAEPRYEPYNPSTLQNYTIKGKTYKVIQNAQNFSEVSLATWYGAEANGNRTSIGEIFDPNAITAAHPTLPLPSYVRVTNLSNGRLLVVRVNDRGPYTPGRIIDLSKAAGDRLNISNNTKVKVEAIVVAPDGTLSGPGTIGTTVAKESFALPDRPNLGASGLGTPVMETSAPAAIASRPVSNNALSVQNNSDMPASSTSASPSGFLGAPTALRSGVLEDTHAATPVTSGPATTAARPLAVTPAATPIGNSNGRYLVQVGALSDPQRAQTWLKSLIERFHVTGKVTPSNWLYRVQLGPFQNLQQATELQQRLATEAQQHAFVTAADAQ